MEDLLRRFVEGTLGADEPDLYGIHRGHFLRRLRPLDPSFFPGREKSPEAARSLANGAYASFANEPEHAGQPAFVYVVREGYRPATGFLYYWRDSATIRFLRREGSDLLRARTNIQRNVRIHLREAFRSVASRRGQTLWALPEWPPAQLERRPPQLDRLHVPIHGAIGKELIRSVLEAAGAPLTRAEIAAVIERAHGFAREVSAIREVEVMDDAKPEPTLTRALEQKLASFWSALDADDRALLRARGYADGGVANVSFREVAEKLGRLGGESYRLKERKILERLRETFTADEMDDVVRWLVQKLAIAEES